MMSPKADSIGKKLSNFTWQVQRRYGINVQTYMKSSRQQPSETYADIFAATCPVTQIALNLLQKSDTSVYSTTNCHPHLNVCQILVNTGAFRDAVALVEVKSRSEHVLTEPHLGKGVEEPLVIVVSHAATILNFSNHVSHCVPWHALRKYEIETRWYSCWPKPGQEIILGNLTHHRVCYKETFGKGQALSKSTCQVIGNQTFYKAIWEKSENIFSDDKSLKCCFFAPFLKPSSSDITDSLAAKLTSIGVAIVVLKHYSHCCHTALTPPHQMLIG